MSISETNFSKILVFRRLLVLLQAQSNLAEDLIFDGKAKEATKAEYERLNLAFEEVIKAEAKCLRLL